jgi:ABC-type multidrug transport system fused ATPase/permease subunit
VKEPHNGRRSHFDVLLEQNRSQRIRTQTNIDECNEEDEDNEERQPSTDTMEGFQQVSQQLGLAARPSMRRRESAFVDIGDGYNKLQAHMGMDRHVQVNLRNFSYHVPVKMDSPSIKTVLNQSAFYVIYEFFRRVHFYCQRKIPATGWAADTTSDLFLPFDKKAILSEVTLCFEPGKTYLILAPPGGGKTTLLKAIAGRLPYSKDLLGHPRKDKPHIDGRIEFNGVAKEVSLLIRRIWVGEGAHVSDLIVTSHPVTAG